MTGAEWIEMSQNAASNGSAIYAIFLTIMSAYIVVAYMVGKELNRSQLLLINTFFLFSAGVSILLLLGACQKHAMAFNQAAMKVNELQAYSEASVVIALVLLGVGNTFFMLAGLKLMWDIRHPKAE